MFRRSSDGISVPASIRMNDGAILIGTINCGASGRLETLLNSESSFIEFVSKDGQQRFMARHQIASIEPLGMIANPCLPQLVEESNPFALFGLKADDSLEAAMAAFHRQLGLYSPQRWTGQDIPFEFSRYAAEKTRQINMAFTVVRAAMQKRDEELKNKKQRNPLFGGSQPNVAAVQSPAKI